MELEFGNAYWWEQKEKVHETIFGILEFLEQNQNYKHQANLTHFRLYGNFNVLGLSAHTYAQSNIVSAHNDRLAFNIVKSMCDTVTQKICKNKIKPTFLTDEGDFEKQLQAKKLEKFVQGQFYETEFYKKANKAFLSSCVFGTGVTKFYRVEDKIHVEPVFIDEIKFDDTEAMYGDPRSLYQVKFMPKEILARMYPKYKREILEAPRAEPTAQNHQALSNNVMIAEAWHLPSGIDTKDGRHVICLKNVTLYDEEWKRDHYPFEFMKFGDRLQGFLGFGLAEELRGLQVEINKILRTVQLSFHLVGIPKYLIEYGSKVIKSHLNNEIGGMIYYSGTPPEVTSPTPISPEILSHLDRLIERAYAIAGVSQLAASSQKPAGLNSGKALRTYHDIESERFVLVGQAWEDYHIRSAKQLIELAKEIEEECGEYQVMVAGQNGIEKIDWKEVNLEKDEYVMKIFPTSALSDNPAEKFQDVVELMQAGLIDKAHAVRLLDFPDIKQYTSKINAPAENIEKVIENILVHGKPQMPENYQDKTLGIEMIKNAYLKAENEGVPEYKLEMMRNWILMAQDMAAKDAVAAQMATQVQQAPVTGVPGPAPQAELAQTAPQGIPGGL